MPDFDEAMDSAAALVHAGLAQQFEETRSVLRRTTNPIALATNMHRNADVACQAPRSAAEALHGKALACRRGCSWCCHQPVDATADEILAMAHYVEQQSADWKREFWERVDGYSARVAALPPASRYAILAENLPCPALGKDGICTVYSVRPSACRGDDSFDASVCEDAMVNPDLPGATSMAGQVLFGRLFGHRQALHERGFDGRPYDLAAALAAIGRDGLRTAKGRWANKSHVFADVALPPMNEDEASRMASSIVYTSE